jgi:phosphoribosylanthranilate isomerase
MIRTKICGINSPEAFDAAVAAGADWVGFVLFPPSPRYVTAAAAAALSARHPGGPLRVALLVAPDDAQVAETLATLHPDVLQLHEVTPARAAALRATTGVPVWHAVGVAGAGDLPTAASGIDRVFLDAKAPPDAALPGGNARAFDWSLLRGWTPPAPWVLAGGLTPENVGAAIRATGAEVVDVSSGVERRRGVKDAARIAAFIRAAHAADAGAGERHTHG